MAMLAVTLVIQLVDEAGPPVVLDPDHKLEIPPPPTSMYKIGKEFLEQSSTQEQPLVETSTQEPASPLTPSPNEQQQSPIDTEIPHATTEN